VKLEMVKMNVSKVTRQVWCDCGDVVSMASMVMWQVRVIWWV